MGELNEFVDGLLNIEDPWKVADVTRTVDRDGRGEVRIRVEVPFGHTVRCSGCGRECKVRDRPNERTWRELDMVGNKTLIHARIPRSDCPECGVKQIGIPWARENSRFTLQMESFIMAMVRQMPVATAADQTGEVPNRIWRIAERYASDLVRTLDLSSVRKVGADEKCFSGRDSFLTVFADLDTHRIIFVTEGKDSGTVGKFKRFPAKHGGNTGNISDFSCDFGSAFISGIRKHFRFSGITCDRFHLVKMANEALNDTKCGELKLSVNRMKAKYLLLRNDRNISDGDRETRDRICRDNEILGIAYRLKESLCSLYSMGDLYSAEQHLKGWIQWARFTGMYHFVKLADTAERHTACILQWFTSRLTNAVLEGTNSMISQIKNRARGFHKAGSLISMCYIVSAQEKTDMYGRVCECRR
ncbi:MAG: ISL3 family transposase [Candidatus Methanoplasma sp.]|jgi:transposase|nr:ISL3 family transposase [Candidatus Methanoplasma sp.]